MACCAVDDADAQRLLLGVFGNSPFLTATALLEAPFVASLLAEGPAAAARAIMEQVAEATAAAIDGREPSPALRRAKRHLSLVVALADIAGAWELEAVTGALSAFAEAATGCAAAYLLADAHRRGILVLPHPEEPQRDSGLLIIGMGKLGARELNYSSDIDLIILYDADRVNVADPDRQQHHMVRLSRGLVSILDARTGDGYVFRTDLRLRPDPGTTPLAISVLAAETYYETLGQNWERAAMIKARPVAGDLDAGHRFLRHLKPFIWRKNLDFAAIRDINSIKRQINAHHGGASIALAGHNVKLGRGGIREIEFFVQTQQLIWGGKVPALRELTTEGALQALAEHGQIDGADAADLMDAYRRLRRVEHRLQMINDEQTHSLPVGANERAALATFLGYASPASFETELLATLRLVERHYARLFEDQPALSVPLAIGGNLVFTGTDPDPETLTTLSALGFGNPEAVDAAVRVWHRGRYRATRTERTRAILTELMPFLLQTLGATAHPDSVFLAFDRFLAALPSGVQLFSMFEAHPHVLQLLVEIMDAAPRLAEHLARRPSDLESVLAADFFDPPPPPDHLEAELADGLSGAAGLEDVLDLSRRWANSRKFQVGVQMLRGSLDATRAAEALSNIADTVLLVLLPQVVDAFAARHGRVPDSGLAVIAMGKLGGREMTVTSDLDLIFVYGATEEGAVSDGDRPLPASQYFARLSQRLINAVTAPTAEGTLYEVDMRLRPSGKAGPIAVSFPAFAHYQRSDAWAWERMALTRARVVAGPAPLADAIEAVVRDVLTAPRDADALRAAVADMRVRMDAEHHTDSLWEIKHLRGGLVDVEFIVQYLQLVHAHEHPAVLSPTTRVALQTIGDAGLLDRAVADLLLKALDLWHSVQARIRLAWDGPVPATGPEDVPPALRAALDGAMGLDFDRLAAHMKETAERVHAVFDDIIGVPANDEASLQPSKPGR